VADKAIIDIEARNSQLKETLDDTKQEFSAFGASVAAGVAVAAAALIKKAITAIIDFGEQVLEAFKIQEDAITKLNAVVRATGGAAGYSSGELRKMAEDLQEVATFGDEVTESAQAVLSTFTQVKGDVFQDAIKSAQDMNTVLGGDLQSSVLQLGKALNDPIKGITALSRAGVSFTEEQKETIRTLVEQNKVMEAQRVILAELNKEFGGAAQARAQTGTGRLQQIANLSGDLDEKVGQAWLPLRTFWEELKLDFKRGLVARGETLFGKPEDWENVEVSAEKIDVAAERAAKARERLAKQAEAEAKAQEKINEAIEKQRESLNTSVNVMYRMLNGMSQAEAKARELAGVTEEQAKAISKAAEAQEQWKAAVNASKLTEELEKRTQALEDERDGVDELTRKYRELRDAMSPDQLADPNSTMSRELAKLDEAITRLHEVQAQGIGKSILESVVNGLRAGAAGTVHVPEVVVDEVKLPKLPELKLDDGFQSAFVGLEALNRRIAASAASVDPTENAVRELTAQEMEDNRRIIEQMEAQKQRAKDLFDEAKLRRADAEQQAKDMIDAVKNISVGLI